MSDTSQGPGWWQASDGKWYPPEQAPPAAPTAPPAAGAPPAYGAPAYGTPPAYGAPAAYGAPGGVPGPLASWGQRAIGYLVDIAIVFVIYIAIFVVGAILGAVSDALGTIVILLGYLGVIAYQFYIAFMAGQVGGTPGMRLTGLKLVSEANGELIGGGQGILRGVVAWAISTFTCGIGGVLDYLWPLWDEKHQTLHDKAVKTVVLCDQPKADFGPDVFKLS